MFFSVLIPVYNTSQYLEECVRSVLCQSEQDYEIILVDDGSTDDSGRICDEFAKNHSEVRVFHKANEGLMMTRRRAFKEAKGDYFICLDSDDYLQTFEALTKIRSLIEKEKCDLVLYNYIMGGKNRENDRLITLFDYEDGYVFPDKTELYEKLLIGKFMNNMWIKAVARNIVDIDVDYSLWKADICRGEDRFQSYPMLTTATRVGYIKDALVHYRWTPGSISNNPKLKYYRAYRTIYQREDEYLLLWNMDEEVIKKAKINRIPVILNVIVNGYHASKKSGKLNEWSDFVNEISGDLFFEGLYPIEYKKDILNYYWLLGQLIRKNKQNTLMKILDLYQWYSIHIKDRKRGY